MSMMIVGGWDAIASRCPLPPSSSTSSPCTTFTTCCAGVSEASTSWPTAFSLTRSTKARTTLKFTSASRSATRTSRRASWMFSSDRRPRPPSLSKIVCSRVLRDSSMQGPNFTETSREDQPARVVCWLPRDELRGRFTPLIDAHVELVDHPPFGKHVARRCFGDVESRGLGDLSLVGGRHAAGCRDVHLHRDGPCRYPDLADGVSQPRSRHQRVGVVRT